MRRPPALLALFAAVPLALGACGDDGGDGDLDAFCETAEDIENADEDASEDDFEDLLDNAPDEIRDEVEVLADIFGQNEPDEDEIEEAFDALDELADFLADECDLEIDLGESSDGGDDTGDDGEEAAGDLDEFCAVAEDTIGSGEDPTPSDLEALIDVAPAELDQDLDLLLEFVEAFDAEGEDALDDFDLEALDEAANNVADFAEDECGVVVPEDDFGTDGSDGTDGATPDPGDAEEPPATDDPQFEAFAEDCFDGDMTACDDLWLNTPVGSAEELYGATCGGRLDEDEQVSAGCEALFGPSV